MPAAHAIPQAASQPRAFLEYLYNAAVKRALPLHNMAASLPVPPSAASGGRTIVLGAGKAGASMAQALEAHWPADASMQGLVVTRYGHVPPRPEGLPRRVEVVEASHPIPDAAGQAAAQRMLAMAHGLTRNDLVLCLISGGASALLTLPTQGMTLAYKQALNQALLASGAGIAEMNCVRKHLSRIKGGRLAAACVPARVVTLAISDVPGDDPGTIGSGPTVADATTCADALAVLARYRIDVPASVFEALEQGTLETPKPDDPALAGHQVHLIATAQQSLQAAACAAHAAGLHAYILSDEMQGESCEVGKLHAALARAVARHGQPFARPCVILSGGETSVTLRPRVPGAATGRGGRAGEFCMGLAQALQGQPGVYALAADTDGIDGVEDNAGAYVAPDSLARATALDMQIDRYLERNDAYGFFSTLDDLFVTGPTYTNVNDFRAVLVL